jgi:multiple sugar transport system ATP-binding protein
MNFLPGVIKEETGKLIFDEGRIKLTLLNELKERLTKYLNKQVVLGIRPEDIYEAENAHGISDSASIESVVEVVEPLGNEVFLYLTTGLNSYIARVAARSTPPVDQKLNIVFDMKKVHFFDVNTESAI